MGARVSRTDFEYTYTDEPHFSRRKEILAKYPHIKDLYGEDKSMVFIIPFMLLFQLGMCHLVSTVSWPLVALLAYLIGGTVNQSLTLAMHENSHGNVWGRRYNMTRIFGIVINLPIGLPASISFKKYHADHHQFMGDDVKDTDIPTRLEAWMFTRSSTKILWLILQPLFYSLRPFAMNPKPVTHWELMNVMAQLTWDALVFHLFGAKALVYLIGGSISAMGLHPMAGHFVSEHYLYFHDQQTTSYYGPMNYICWNVGYHNEHHDFPWISYRKLPQVKKIAPEYYDLPHHTSWVKCLVDFVLRDDVGPYARMKQATREGDPFEPVDPKKVD